MTKKYKLLSILTGSVIITMSAGLVACSKNDDYTNIVGTYKIESLSVKMNGYSDEDIAAMNIDDVTTVKEYESYLEAKANTLPPLLVSTAIITGFNDEALTYTINDKGIININELPGAVATYKNDKIVIKTMGQGSKSGMRTTIYKKQ
ncbi:MAG: hypothetical protein Ta2E_02890 [Mycoplasmoidaceae bacterium]|nr:MAG: hypothetical protein Ta2E_02890 [Mycoplasmoidaceae bacterium]